MARRVVLLAALCLLAAGCAGADREQESASTTSAPRPSTDASPPEPGETLDAFVTAAAANDTKAMWLLLTARSRARLGPSLSAFRRGAGAKLVARIAPLAAPAVSRVLSERITLDVAVAAVAAPDAAFAAALRLENGNWLIELGGPIRIRALVPDPGESVAALVHVAAEFKAPTAISEAGLWLDGRAVPAKGGGVSASYLTVFGEAGELAFGAHSMVAFVVAGDEAAALAWPFQAETATPAA